MITTMDRAGRLVIPKSVRESVGLVPGDVEIGVVGEVVTLQVPTASLIEKDGLLMLASGTGLGDDEIREMRLALQR